MYICCSFSTGPTVSLPHSVHKSILYICISIPSLQIGSWVPFISFFKKNFRGLPWRPRDVKTLCSHCRGWELDPWWGELGSHMLHGTAKIKWNDGAFKHYFRDGFLHLILLYNYVNIYMITSQIYQTKYIQGSLI